LTGNEKLAGTIILKNLKLQSIIGIHPDERQSPQDLLVDLELDCDFRKAAKDDGVESTVDYEQLALSLKNWAMAQKFKLIETFAEKACLLIFENWKTIKRCKIKVKKPSAITFAAYAAVYIDRHRPE
jgi:FolB domain-containing protein